MTLNKIILIGCAAILGLSVLSYTALAEGDVADEANSAIKSIVQIYGQTLDMTNLSISDEDYTWNQLKVLLPKVFPDAASSSKTPNALCDHLSKGYDSYAVDSEGLTAVITSALVKSRAPMVLEDVEGGGQDVVELPEEIVFDKLLSTDIQDVKELADALPNHQSEVKLARDVTLNVLMIMYLHHAALEQCSAHAMKKGYASHMADLPPIYDPDTDPDWAKFEAQLK